MLSELLNKGQIRDLAKAHQDGSDMLFKITQKQVGNGIGSILATIGIPMIIDALKGKGVGRGGPRLNKSGGWWSEGKQDERWSWSKDRFAECIHLLL